MRILLTVEFGVKDLHMIAHQFGKRTPSSYPIVKRWLHGIIHDALQRAEADYHRLHPHDRRRPRRSKENRIQIDCVDEKDASNH